MELLQAALAAHVGQAAKASSSAGSSGGGPSAAVLELLQLAQSASGPLDVHICSPGGVGSTHLSNFLTRRGLSTNLVLDTDGLRHVPTPPPWSVPNSPATPHPSKPRSVVYVYGDPYYVVASHYRRGHAHHQVLKTHPKPAQLGPEALFPATVEEYFSRRQDLFGLEAHFRAWRKGAPAYDILLVRYEDMFQEDVALDLFRRLCAHKLSPEEVNRMAVEWAASQTVRHSHVPLYVREGGLYGELERDMESLPPLYVVHATGAPQEDAEISGT